MKNPFLNNLASNSLLNLDLCQRIHFTALRRSMRLINEETIPSTVPIHILPQRLYQYGAEVCIVHPAEIALTFHGTTLAVYRKIEELYVTRLDRSVQTVFNVLRRMAEEADTTPLSYEAVWSICLYLDEKHAAETAVTRSQSAVTWLLIQIHPAILLQENGTEPYRPCIICIIEVPAERIIAFQVSRRPGNEAAISLAFYEALISQRQPEAVTSATAGLHWLIPSAIQLDNLALPPNCIKVCKELGIVNSVLNEEPEIRKALRGNWDRDLANRILGYDHFLLIFNTFLRRIHGHGPYDRQAQRADEFDHLLGYNRDPAWQFPALRDLLPSQLCKVADDGSVECGGLHFEDDLLRYWIGSEVVVRRSLHNAAAAYIYLNNEILCLAMARELRRRDGSYRTKLPQL